jgi:hypothetical protein
MKRRMHDESWTIRMSDLESLTPSQRSVLIEQLIRQARKARARAIRAALLRLVRALCGVFRWLHGSAARRPVVQR